MALKAEHSCFVDFVDAVRRDLHTGMKFDVRVNIVEEELHVVRNQISKPFNDPIECIFLKGNTILVCQGLQAADGCLL